MKNFFMFGSVVASILVCSVSVCAQGSRPLETRRGHLMDHVGLSVTDLDAWVAKLKREGVTFLELPHKLGNTRAAMIEGPSMRPLS